MLRPNTMFMAQSCRIKVMKKKITRPMTMTTPTNTTKTSGRSTSRSSHFFFSEHMLDNSGSLARDILAVERTFLAWARTGLGFVGAGSALFAAYHRHETVIQEDIVPASALLLVNGSFLLAFATRRYIRVVDAITNHNKFPIQVGGTLGAVFVTAIGTVSSLGLVARAEARAAAREQPKSV